MARGEKKTGKGGRGGGGVARGEKKTGKGGGGAAATRPADLLCAGRGAGRGPGLEGEGGRGAKTAAQEQPRRTRETRFLRSQFYSVSSSVSFITRRISRAGLSSLVLIWSCGAKTAAERVRREARQRVCVCARACARVCVCARMRVRRPAEAGERGGGGGVTGGDRGGGGGRAAPGSSWRSRAGIRVSIRVDNFRVNIRVNIRVSFRVT